MSSKYKMTISRLTVDKLGVKLYDRVSAVIAELIANSYDADARMVEIEAPMGELLATKSGAKLIDKGFTIIVRDNGIGMTPDEVNPFYLTVGRERRNDPARGDTSRELKRKVMGRKGVGKLAPFGICTTIDVISAGGKPIAGKTVDGKPAKGYLTAHFILERDKILNDTDRDYNPLVGERDGTVQDVRGTTLILRNFAHRHVPSLNEFERQLSQRFGIASPDWQIKLIDTTKTVDDPDRVRVVGGFNLEKMEHTEIRFDEVHHKGKVIHRAIGADGKERTDIEAGFTYEGRFYPVTGWVAYAKRPYKDDLMAGVRIYCRGKIASQTSIFNNKAGFTGEHDVRSYFIGELHVDWLDEAEDLIQTDRRDILWSHELGQAFEQWGQKLVRIMGKLTRDPLRKNTWELFQEISQLHERIATAFPAAEQGPIRERARDLAKLIGQNMRQSELSDAEHVSAMVQLTLNLAPHVTLTDNLKAAADAADSPLAAVTGLLKTARVAELSAFGLIALERVKVITKVEELKDDPTTLEDAFQELITQAPWLIDPQWSPIVSNQSFATLRSEFEKIYEEHTGQPISLTPFASPPKRCDFVMSMQDNIIQIIEIKRPNYKLAASDMQRIDLYVTLMADFLSSAAHAPFKQMFQDFHVTLVCDGLAIKGVERRAFDGLVTSGKLTHLNWRSFLLNTRRMHEEFLTEAERQKRDAAKEV